MRTTEDEVTPDPKAKPEGGDDLVKDGGSKTGKSSHVDETKEVKREESLAVGRSWADAAVELGTKFARPWWWVPVGLCFLLILLGVAIVVLVAGVVAWGVFLGQAAARRWEATGASISYSSEGGWTLAF